MDQKERRMYLLKYLLAENPQAGIGRIPDEEKEQKALLRGLMNIRMPQPVSSDFLTVQDAYLKEMVAEQRDMRIPADLIPRCPKCGGQLAMNLRCDDTFVEDKGWQMAADRYEDFIRRHAGLRVVYLELGVGANTPGIIKYPFWQMTAGNENATYACVNMGEAYCPAEIRERSTCIDGDIKDFLDEMLKADV